MNENEFDRWCAEHPLPAGWHLELFDDLHGGTHGHVRAIGPNGLVVSCWTGALGQSRFGDQIPNAVVRALLAPGAP